CTSRSYYW
nr:immunoglobulin heavy chain junction region [Macaca mulatta]